MRIQVTLHLKSKEENNPSAIEIAALHKLVERWANELAQRNSLMSLFDAEVIDVFRVDAVGDYLDTERESPF